MKKSLTQFGLEDFDDPIRRFFDLGPIDLKTLEPIDLESRRFQSRRFVQSHDSRKSYPAYSFYPPSIFQYRLREYFAPYALCDNHVQDLGRLLLNTALLEGEYSSRESWALKHAWRAVLYLSADGLAGELLALLNIASVVNDGNGSSNPATVAAAASTELPDILLALGPSTLPAIANAILTHDCNWWFSAQISVVLQEMAQRYPAARHECVSILTTMLQFDPKKPELSYSYAAWSLLALDAAVDPDLIRIHVRKKLFCPDMGLNDEGIALLTGSRAARSVFRGGVRYRGCSQAHPSDSP